MQIYYVGDENKCAEVLDAFENAGFLVRTFDAPDTAQIALEEMAFLKAEMPSLVLLDATDPGTDLSALRTAIQNMLRVHAFLHVCAVTGMKYGLFHEAMEGLGMLRPLPLNPTAADAQRLLEKLRSLMPQ